MAKLPPYRSTKTKTAELIFEAREKEPGEWRRQHLGCSIIGRACSRELWYSFRWSMNPKHPGRLLRLFERGQNEEDGLARDMRLAGLEVQQYDEDGRQLRVKFGAHIGGSRDGTVTGVPEAPKSPHVWECKTTNLNGYRKLQKEGVQAAKPEHYAQMQLYMLGAGLKRALYTAVCKDNDHIHAERVHFDERAAQALVRKAEAVVASPEPLTRISRNPSWWQCKFCDHHSTCQLGDHSKIERNCRTCLSSTAEDDGSWTCTEFVKSLPFDEQCKGCTAHRFIPQMLSPWKPIGRADRTITYRKPDGSEWADEGGEV